MNRILAGGEGDYRWRPTGHAAAEIQEQKHLDSQRVMVPEDEKEDPRQEPADIADPDIAQPETLCQTDGDIGQNEQELPIDAKSDDGYIEKNSV